MSPSVTKRGVAVLSEGDEEVGSSSSSSRRTTRRRAKKPRTSVHESSVDGGGDTTPRLSRGSPRSTRRSAMTPEGGFTRVVTPSLAAGAFAEASIAIRIDDSTNGDLPVRRALLTPSGKTSTEEEEKLEPVKEPNVKRRLAFGRYYVDETQCPKNVQDVYKIIGKLTGSVGGNGSFGAIYGELTVGSMQKIVQLMKMHTNFTSSSRFIDVGSGLAKPSLHVCQDPGVEFSYGIEMEMSRWMLGMANLQAVIKAARHQSSGGVVETDSIGYNCFLDHGNIMDATSFDPFTHVYMFSIGFPPRLWEHMSEMFNRSSAPYLICYHSPSDIIDKYGFNVQLSVQTPTSMHGSSEGHMGYIYARNKKKRNNESTPGFGRCDPLFKNGWETVKGGLEYLELKVESIMQEACHNGRLTRSRGAKMTIVSKIEQEEEAIKQAKNE